MRCAMAAVLALVLGWHLCQPALAASTRTMVPQCCRKDGKHKCMLHAAGSDTSGSAMSTIAEKCTSYPQSTIPAQFGHFMPPTRQAVFADLLRHPSVVSQTEARFRISHDRSRQRRGPPSSLLA